MRRPSWMGSVLLVVLTGSCWALANESQHSQVIPAQRTLLLASPMAGAPTIFLAQALTGTTAPAVPDPWPKSADVGGVKYTMYQPQLDSWDNYNYRAHSAISVLPAGSKDPVFGVVEISATTIVEKQAKAVHFENLQVTKATFPSAPQMAATYQQTIQGLLSQGPATMSLGRLEAALAIEGASRKAQSVPVLNEPPRIVFATSATVLVLIHGQ